MAPFVIDSSTRQQYLIIFIIAMLLSFSLGYWLGAINHQAESAQTYDELKSQILIEPETPAAVEENEGDKVPEEQPATEVEEKDKKKDESKVAASKSSVTAAKVEQKKTVISKTEPQPEVKSAPVKVTPKPEPPPKPVVIAKPESKPKPVNTQAADVKAKSSSPSSESQPEKPSETSAVSNESSESADDNTEKSGFSVQVGLFANRENAQNLVDELIEKGFDAYMADFVSSSGEVKYNVRFGQFSDRQSVQEKLAEYKQLFSTPAYIVINK